jgi:hypothetical protein
MHPWMTGDNLSVNIPLFVYFPCKALMEAWMEPSDIASWSSHSNATMKSKNGGWHSGRRKEMN